MRMTIACNGSRNGPACGHATAYRLGAVVPRPNRAVFDLDRELGHWCVGRRVQHLPKVGRDVAALDLLLVLNRRATPGDAAVEVAGDERLLAHWLEHSVFA